MNEFSFSGTFFLFTFEKVLMSSFTHSQGHFSEQAISLLHDLHMPILTDHLGHKSVQNPKNTMCLRQIFEFIKNVKVQLQSLHATSQILIKQDQINFL